MDQPVVSVVIPTYNRRERLGGTLAGLAAQRNADGMFEVIVVSDGSTDGTNEFLTSGALPLEVVALTQRNAGPAAARNRGVGAARGELVVFLDDDVVPNEDLVAAHLRHHDGPSDDRVVIGPMRTPSGFPLSAWVQWEQDMLYKQYDAMDRGEYEATARQFYTGNASVARRHLEAVGGFDVAFRRAEDVELAYRLAGRGLQFSYAPDAVVLHYAEPQLRRLAAGRLLLRPQRCGVRARPGPELVARRDQRRVPAAARARAQTHTRVPAAAMAGPSDLLVPLDCRTRRRPPRCATASQALR